MKKGIFAMFILVASMAMVACTNNASTTEGATGENDAFKALEKRREYYKAQDKERAKLEAEAKKAEEKAMKEAATQVEATTEETPVAVDDAEARKAEEKAMKEAAKAKEAAEKEALKILEKKRKGN